MKRVQEATAASTSAFNQQLRVVMQMRDAIDQVAKQMGALCSKECSGMAPEKWDEVSERVKAFEDRLRGASDAAEAAAKENDRLAGVAKGALAKGLIIAAAALDGLRQGMKNAAALTKSVAGLFGSIVSGAYAVAKSIIAIPFKMISGLFKMATSGGGGNELAQAIENVRENFGSLKSEASQTVMDVAKGMGKLDSSGVSAFRIFGNLAQRMEEVNKLAGAMGNAFIANIKEFQTSGEAIMRYQRGLGITDDQMGAIAQSGARMGKTMEGVLNDMTKQSLGMAKAFGVNAKLLSKDMTKALQDVKNFGSLSSKELAVAATYAQKLGVSIDKLTASMDATKTFDSSAEAVAKLNEQFGTNIDATELMMEENPAKQQEMLRKALLATGKDMSKLNRFEREMIKSTGLMNDEMIDAGFAAKNAGVSLDKISKQGDKNEKKTLSQAEAMTELADAIKRIVPSGGGSSSSIFGRIFEGFTAGIQNTQEFRALMMNINKILMQAFVFGQKLGRMFVQLFPGVKQILGGLAGLFSPARWGAMFDGVIKAFDVLKTGGVNSMKDFVDNIGNVFKQFFSSGKGPANQVVEGFKMMGKAMVAILASLGNIVVDKLIEWVPKITEAIPKLFAFLKKPKEGEVLPKLDVPAWAQPVVDLFMKIKDVLVPELGKMFKALWKEVGPGIKDAGMDALKGILLVSFGPVALKAVGGAIIGSIAKAAGGMIKDFFMGSAAQKEAVAGLKAQSKNFAELARKEMMHSEQLLATSSKKATKKMAAAAAANAERLAVQSAQAAEQAAAKSMTGFSKLGKLMEGNLGKVFKLAGPVVAIATAAIDISDAMKKFGGELEKKGFDPATAKIAAGTTGIINTLTFGLLPESWQGKIAEALASGVKAMFGLFDKWFGPGFSDSIKKYLSSAFDIFAGLGDLLKAMWNGDSKGVMDALKKIGSSFMDAFLSTFEILANVLLKIGPLILEYLFKAIGWVSNKIGDIFLSLKDIPVVGFIFDWIGSAFKWLGDLFNKAGKGWEMIGDVLKKVNITQTLRDFGNSVIDFAKLVWDKFTWLVDVLTMPTRIAFNLWKTYWQAIWQEALLPVINFAMKWGPKVLSWLTYPQRKAIEMYLKFAGWMWDNVWNPIINSAVSFGQKVFEIISWPYKKWYEVVSGVVGFLWDTFKNLLEKFRAFGHELLDILQDPHMKASDKIKEFVDKIWGAFKELPGKYVAWGKELLDKITSPFKGAWEWIKENFSVEKFKEIGKAMIDGLLEYLSKLPDLMKEKFQEGIKAAKKAIRMGSPSKDTAEIGQAMVDGTMNSLQPLPEQVGEKYSEASKSAASSSKAPSLSEAGIPDQKALENLFKSLEAMSGSLKITGDLKGQIDAFIANAQHLAESFSKLPTAVMPIVETVKKINSEIFAGDEAKNAVESVKQLIDLFDGINKIGDLGKIMSAGKKGSGDSVGDKIWSLTEVCGHIAEELTRLGGATGLPLIMTAVKSVTASVSEGGGELSQITTTIKTVIDVLTSISSLGDAAKKISDAGDLADKLSSFNDIMTSSLDAVENIPSNAAPLFKAMTAGAIKKLPIEQAQKSIQIYRDVVKTIQDMDDALSKTPKINIAARMSEAAGKLGLGSSGVYTVKSKEVVINVHFEVNMSASEVEKAIVFKSDSIIRSRINLALSDKASSEDRAGGHIYSGGPAPVTPGP